jgi:hypothetical protein
MATKAHLKGITTPTPDEVPALVDRQSVIGAEISKMEAELEVIKYKLSLYALAQPRAERLKDDENRDGRRVRIPGTMGQSTIVTITADRLIASFKDGSPKHRELLDILTGDVEASDITAEELLTKYFAAPDTWSNRHKSGLHFRQAAAEYLTADTAAALIAACRQVDKHGVPKNAINVEIKADAEEEPS